MFIKETKTIGLGGPGAIETDRNQKTLHLPAFLRLEGTSHANPSTRTGSPALQLPPTASGEQNQKIARLLTWVAWAAFLVTGAMFIAGIQLNEGLLLVGGGSTTGVGVFMLGAAQALRRGKERRGALMLSIALLLGASAYTIVIPGGASALALLPVIIVAVVLPFVKGAAITRFLFASWAVGFALVAVNIVYHPPSGLPLWFTVSFRVLGFAAILALTLSLLFHHHQRLTATAEKAQSDAAALQKAHEELKRSDETKTRFLNSAAHELRTPLTPVLIQLELMHQHPAVQDDPRLRHSAQLINRNMRRLKAHVDELLDIARLQSGRFPLRLQTVELDPLMQDAEESFQGITKEKGIRFDVKSTPGIRLKADPNRLMQVIFNLLSNAVKATPSGGRIVLFSETEGEACSIHVCDTGRGIPKEDQDRLFQPFEQLAAQEHEKDGAGLGLFISRNIVEAHHGKISFESPGDGKGATFTVTLPLIPDEDGPTVPRRASPHPPESDPFANEMESGTDGLRSHPMLHPSPDDRRP